MICKHFSSRTLHGRHRVATCLTIIRHYAALLGRRFLFDKPAPSSLPAICLRANKMQNHCTKTDFSNPATGCDKMAALARNADITGYRLAGIGTPCQFRNRDSLPPVPEISCDLRSLRLESVSDRSGWRGSRTSTDRDRGKPHRPSMQGLIALIGLLNDFDETDAPCVFDHSDQGTKSPMKVLLPIAITPAASIILWNPGVPEKTGDWGYRIIQIQFGDSPARVSNPDAQVINLWAFAEFASCRHRGLAFEFSKPGCCHPPEKTGHGDTVPSRRSCNFFASIIFLKYFSMSPPSNGSSLLTMPSLANPISSVEPSPKKTFLGGENGL